MNWTRSITLLFAALLQVWPAWGGAAVSDSSSACPMSCCAWQADAGVHCGCVSDSSEPAPAQAPPASSRDLLPLPLLAADSATPFHPAPVTPSEPQLPRGTDPALTTAPHVRLAVLHCSFLL